MRKTIIDLSHTIEDGMETYPGLPAPVICDFWSREESALHYDGDTSFQIGKIEMVANTGTYMDAPFHRYAEGKDLSQLPLSRIADLEGIRFRIPEGQRVIGPECFQEAPLDGKAVLIETAWCRHWRTPQYFDGHPYLSEAAAVFLRDAGVCLVGIDSLNIDDTTGRSRPVHSTLLGADIPIVEHMRGLDRLPDRGFRFHAVPAGIRGLGSFPVRAYAILPAGADN